MAKEWRQVMGISSEQAVLALHSLVSRETLTELIEELLLEGQNEQSVAHGFYRACVDLIPSKGFRKGPVLQYSC